MHVLIYSFRRSLACELSFGSSAIAFHQATDLTLGIRASRMRRRKTDTEPTARNNLRAVESASGGGKAASASPEFARRLAAAAGHERQAHHAGPDGLIPAQRERARAGSGGAAAGARMRAATGPAPVTGRVRTSSGLVVSATTGGAGSAVPYIGAAIDDVHTPTRGSPHNSRSSLSGAPSFHE